MKFLRFFRVKSDNRKDYLKYAIGEIFLVVIGILIALSVNNSNEERKLRKEEKDNNLVILIKNASHYRLCERRFFLFV